jgi:hypothetical protein
MTVTPPHFRPPHFRLPNFRGLVLALAVAILAGCTILAGCALRPTVASVAAPPIPSGYARIWVYRIYLLNMTKVTLNGVYAGYAQLGGAFYRDVPPGTYHVEVASWGKDFDQSTNVALVPGQEAYVRIDSLDSWSTIIGAGFVTKRDTFYARLIFPQVARAEMAQSFYDGGS